MIPAALRTSRRFPVSTAILLQNVNVLNIMGETLVDLPGAPARIYFPYWSKRLPPEIYEQYECVMFHMTDLPYGRGGSPLQNLIAAGHTLTMMTAFRATAEMDAGPVYLKAPLELTGPARDIYDRADGLILRMIQLIQMHNITPQPQAGPVTEFRRRKPEESLLPTEIDRVYDHIRMLDADGYPHAFVNYGDLRLEFTDAEQAGEEVTARVRITRR